MNLNKKNPICYLCKSVSCTKIHDQIRYNLSPRPYRCDNCGFIFLYPKMSEDMEKKFYSECYRNSYTHQTPKLLWSKGLPEAKKRIHRFKNYLSNDLNVLEIGCSSGYFLSEIKEYVSSTTGLELTNECVDYANSMGLNVHNSINDIENDSYDLIFMFHGGCQKLWC